MDLICVGTGSSGNTYLLTNGEETLILEAGMPFLEVKKTLDFNVMTIRAVLVTHAHKDHSKYAHEYEASGIPVWKPYESDKLRQDAKFGGFRVQSVPMIHDVPCVGYLIGHKDMGKMLYASDTAYITYRFNKLNVMLIEANYADEFIDKSAAKFKHVLTGHMSINTAVDFINANVSNKLNHVILCHLSKDGSDASAFTKAVEKVVPAGCTVDIAAAGKTVNLNDTPF